MKKIKLVKSLDNMKFQSQLIGGYIDNDITIDLNHFEEYTISDEKIQIELITNQLRFNSIENYL